MLLVGLSLCARAQIRDTLIISQGDVTIELDDQGYHHIRYGSNYVMEAGAPELPIVTKQYYIPHSAEDVQLIANVLGEQNLEGIYNIYPSQGAVPTNQVSHHFAELSEEWNDTIYPSTSAEIVSDNRIFGYRIVTVCFHPFVYDIGNKVLTTRNVAISLEYTIGAIEDAKASQSAYRRNKCFEYVKNLVENPELLEEDEPIAAASTYSREVPIRLFAEERPIPDFIIITNEELKPAFKRLAEWKTRRGIFTIIETTEYIDSVCPGIDLCEKIRNYIQEKEDCWGEGLAILLGGGIDIIPARTFEGAQGYEVTDLYYVDRKYRQPNPFNSFTSFDIGSTIGRFPVNNVQEANILITKNLIYETGMANFTGGHINNSLIVSGFIGMDESSLYEGHMYELYDYVNYTPNKKHWYLFDYFNQSDSVLLHGKKYALVGAKTGIEGQGEELTRSNFLKALSAGQDTIGKFHFVYQCDHSGPYSMGASLNVKGQSITSKDMKELALEQGFYQVILSTGCHPADFSTTCIGKEFLMKPQAGAVAFMGNTDVGWSDEHYFLDEFYKTMFGNTWDWESHLGNYWLHILTKMNEEGGLRSRFHILGDPTLAFWTEEPKNYRNSYSLDDFFLMVTRPYSLQGKGSTICVYKEDEVYLIDTLCTRREMTFYLRDIKTPGYVYITTTGLGQYPQVDSIYMDIVAAENLLEVESVELIDTIDGNGDGCVMPGETFGLNVTYRSLSNNAETGIKLYASPVEGTEYVAFLTSAYATLPVLPQAGDTCQRMFMYRMKKNLPDLTGHNRNGVQFDLSYSTPQYNYLQTYSVDVVNPILSVWQVDTSLVNANSFNLDVAIMSRGEIPFVGGTAVLRSTNDSIAIIDSICEFSVSISKDERMQVSFACESAELPIATTTLLLIMHDDFGNIYNLPIQPLKGIPNATMLRLQPGGDYIDISGDISELYCTTTGEALVTQGADFYRHAPLLPLTTYSYKYKRKVNGKESNLSMAYSAMTTAHNLGGFPEIVENASAFRGLVNCWDVNHDGQQEIFAATWDYIAPDGSLVAITNSGKDFYRDNDPYMLESFAQTQGNFMNGVAIGELYDDGEQYIVSATYNDNLNTVNSVYCHKATDYDGDGYPDLHWKLDSTLINSPRSPIIADLDGDDINEVIVPSMNNVTIFEADGTIRKTISCSISYKHLAVANVKPGGKGKQLLIPSGKTLAVYDSKGTYLSQYDVMFSGNASTPVVCDYDNDGYMESIVGELLAKEEGEIVDTIAIYAIKYKENQVEKKKLFDYPRPLVGRVDAPFAVGDLDKDNRLEIVAISSYAIKTSDDYVYYTDRIIVYNDFIEKKNQQFPFDTSEALHHIPILADIDGDSYLDVVYQYGSSRKGDIRALNYANGSKKTLTSKLYTITNDGLTLSDIDNDGYLDIVCGTLGGRIFAFKTKGTVENLEWGFSRANPQNTGEYGKISYPTILKTGTYSEEVLENDLYVTGNSVTIKNNTVTFAPHRKIVVWRDGVLNIDGATLNNARIVVRSGGKLNVTNGAVINSRDERSFVISKGGRLKISNGKIK